MSDDVNFLSQLVRDSMELQAQEAISKTDDQEYDVVKPLQVSIIYIEWIVNAKPQSKKEKIIKLKIMN